MMSPVSIEATIQLAADGDQAAWDTIVKTYWRKVFNVAYRFVGTYEEAEDLTQEIFLKVFRSLGTFDRRANFQTWLISVSRNFCIDRYRSGRRDRQVFAREIDASTVQAEAPGLNAHARVPVCGVVAWYNLAKLPEGVDRTPSLMTLILRKRLRVQGFIIFDHYARMPAAAESA